MNNKTLATIFRVLNEGRWLDDPYKKNAHDARNRQVSNVMAGIEQRDRAKDKYVNGSDIADSARRIQFTPGNKQEIKDFGMKYVLRDAKEHDTRFNTGGALENHIKEIASGKHDSKFPYDE